MKNKFLLGFILVFMSFSFVFPKQAAARLEGVDQGCTSATDEIKTDISLHRAYQVFTPEKNTLDKVGIYVTSPLNGPVKIRIKIASISSVSTGIIAEKTAVSEDSRIGWITVDLDDVAMPSGIYMLGVETLYGERGVYWQGTTWGCYSNGYAVVDGVPNRGLDLHFAIYAYDKEEEAASNTTTEENTDSTIQESSDSSVQEPSTSEPAPTDRSNQDNSSTVTDQSQTSQVNTKNDNTGTGKAQIIPAPPGDTSNMNNPTPYTAKVTSDEELEAIMSWAMADYKAHKSKGVFGHGGLIGKITTWPFVVGYAVIVLLIICFFILRLIKNDKSKQA